MNRGYRLQVSRSLLTAFLLLVFGPAHAAAVDEPTFIAVCLDRPACSSVTVPLFETQYVHDVLPKEWLCSWSSNSLKSGAVAVRTYGWWRRSHPRSTLYDIYDDTADQVYVAGSSGSPGAAPCNSAVNNTGGTRIEYSASRINAQYRAETGNPTANGGTAYLTSVSDPHTTVGTMGPGLCQNGSQWYGASGTAYTTILHHYYSSVTVATGAFYFLSESCSCTVSGCHRTEYWKDTSSGNTITRVYTVGSCAS